MNIIVARNEGTADKNSNDNREKYVSQLQKYYSNVYLANTSIDVQVPLDDGKLLGIERKSPMDFLASISDGRLKQQVEHMHQVCKFVAVLITGSLNWANEFVIADKQLTKWKSVDVRGMWRTIQLSGTIIETIPSKEYAMQIMEIYKTCNHEHGRHIIKRRIVTFPPIDERVQFIAQLPTIGLKLSDSLMKSAYRPLFDNDDEYGSIAYAFEFLTTMSRIDKDLRPDGWGPKKIIEVRKFLGLQSNEYLAVKQEMIDDKETTEK